MVSRMNVEELKERGTPEASFGDLVLMTVVTGGIFLLVLIGVVIYVQGRAFTRRFILKMPDWRDF